MPDDPSSRRFDDKQSAREAVWSHLEDAGIARFPFPPTGRIPNFEGSADAAERLAGTALFEQASAIKCNPDSPQRHVRIQALKTGKKVLMPTPRLRAGFWLLDPDAIDDDALQRAAALSHVREYGEQIALEDLPPIDLIVAGSVAVTEDGRRCGKGEGYSDLEYGILRELGHDAAPVVTTVHECQVVRRLPRDAHDLPLTLIATPVRVIEVEDPPAPPERGIDWDLLTDEDLEEMPVLRELKGGIDGGCAWAKTTEDRVGYSNRLLGKDDSKF